MDVFWGGIDITCLDYSEDMLLQAQERFEKEGIVNTRTVQGDVGALPFEDESFDTVLSMNGIHVFPDKEKAWSEMKRVLKKDGYKVACFCIKGESRISDWLSPGGIPQGGIHGVSQGALLHLSAEIPPNCSRLLNKEVFVDGSVRSLQVLKVTVPV